MVSDSIDAMATDRPYRAALGREEIRRELATNTGTQFDPDVVQATLESGILEELLLAPNAPEESERPEPIREVIGR